ncbi:MAG: hypothetical protein EXR67_03485 [Dehalococcoidia bacterium]|nr:hypothetical protein [Dehalococcoidia bacterium]
MFQRWTVKGQRWAGLINGIVIGFGVESIIFTVKTGDGSSLLFGIGFILIGVFMEFWQRNQAKNLPDTDWRWGSGTSGSSDPRSQP